MSDWIYVYADDTSVPLNLRALHAAFGRAARIPPAERYVLRLYVTGLTPRSARAVSNLRTICDEYLEGQYDLEVIDIYQQPVLTHGEGIIAAPTLIKKLPLPIRRIIGDMSNREGVLVGLDIVHSPDHGVRR